MLSCPVVEPWTGILLFVDQWGSWGSKIGMLQDCMFWYLLFWCESRYILGVKVGIFFLDAVIQPKLMKQRSVVRHAPLAKYIQCNVRGIISFNCSEKRETRVTFVENFYLGWSY